jgi:hypothetical protein
VADDRDRYARQNSFQRRTFMNVCAFDAPTSHRWPLRVRPSYCRDAWLPCPYEAGRPPRETTGPRYGLLSAAGRKALGQGVDGS